MSEPKGEYLYDVIGAINEEWQKYLTPAQMHTLISQLRELCITGYGEVTICFEGKAVYFKTTTSLAAGKRP